MPLTPYHFGPALLVEAFISGSLRAFVVTTVAIDLEPGYRLLTHTAPVHGLTHTLIGATAIAALIGAVLIGVEWIVRRRRPLNPDGSRRAPTRHGATAAGALLAATSHVGLDALFHADVAPLGPWSDTNPLYLAIPRGATELGCVACAVLAMLVFFRQLGKVDG